MKTPGSKILTVLSLAAAFDAVIAETSIELVAPIEGSDGPQFGLIFIPGATLGGETYGPLSKAIQVLSTSTHTHTTPFSRSGGYIANLISGEVSREFVVLPHERLSE